MFTKSHKKKEGGEILIGFALLSVSYTHLDVYKRQIQEKRKMKKRKQLMRIVFGRTTFVVLFLLIQVAVLLLGISWLEDYTLYFYGASVILSAVVLIYIISADESSTIKLSWVCLLYTSLWPSAA